MLLTSVDDWVAPGAGFPGAAQSEGGTASAAGEDTAVSRMASGSEVYGEQEAEGHQAPQEEAVTAQRQSALRDRPPRPEIVFDVAVDGQAGGSVVVRIPFSNKELRAIDYAVLTANVFWEPGRRRQASGDARSVTQLQVQSAAVVGVLQAAFAAAEESYGIRAAQEFGADFAVWPLEVRQRDAALLQRFDGDFERACAAHQKAGACSRLSAERVRQCVSSDNPDFSRLMRIAEGISISTPADFVPSATPPEMRTKYKKHVANAVNKLLYKQWKAGTVLLLPTAAVKAIPGVHFSPQHWTTKPGKACGRCLCDVANSDGQSVPLNGLGALGKEEMRRVMTEEWGPIVHPSVTDLALMLWRAVSRYGADSLELWKLDLSGAFNLMDIAPSSAKLLAFELTGGMSVIHVTGMFGWVGTPYCFQVVTRVLSGMCRRVIVGECLWYVDDCMGISLCFDVDADVHRAAAAVESLLGEASVAPDKFARGRRLVCLGWTFDLDRLAVTISHRNLLKGLHAFFSFDLDLPVSLSVVERLASLASRYAMLCTQMKPFTTALYALIRFYDGNRTRKRVLSPLAQVDVTMWRSFLCLLHFDENNFARPLVSFTARAPSVLFEYDASLTGFGAGVSLFSAEKQRWEVACYASLPMPYPVDENDSSFQNSNEYLGIMLCLLLVKQTGCVAPGFTFNVCGDNTTSLSWCAHDRVCSTLARRANIGFSLLSVDLDASVAAVSHIAGVDNVVYDGLSRGKSGAEVGLPPELHVELGPDAFAVRYLLLCNPHLPALESTSQHTALAVSLLDLLGSVTREQL